MCTAGSLFLGCAWVVPGAPLCKQDFLERYESTCEAFGHTQARKIAV